ncbi:thioredoxin family protein [Neolewinella persica]|uniref:thioredoxin family protein n=1 Tax=Neolewinella persica TaxID=70998 RepID=UPI0003815153|nr:thioredoxin domain-containing protein [Neolewinella persica]
MKHTFYLLLCLFSLSVTAQQTSATMTLKAKGADDVGMTFVEKPFDELLAQAKKENKVIFIDAYTTWCGPCKMMAAKVFPLEEVGKVYNERFINAKFDMEKGEGPGLARRYGVAAYPTYLFVDGNGDIVHKGIGYIQQEEFLALADAATGENSLGAMNKRYESGERDAGFILTYTEVLTSLMEDGKARKLAGEYLDMQEDLSAPGMMELLLLNPGEAGSKRMTFLLENADDAIKASSAGTFMMTIQRSLVTNYMKEKGAQQLPAADEMAPIYKAHGGAIAQRLTDHYNMLYAEQTRDNEAYVPAAVKYYNAYGSDNAMELNSVAWTVFETSDDPEQLKAALGWAKKSVEMEPGYANMDTLAWLYSKTGNKEMAKKTAMEAIELAKKDGQDYSETAKILDEK